MKMRMGIGMRSMTCKCEEEEEEEEEKRNQSNLHGSKVNLFIATELGLLYLSQTAAT